MGAPSSPQFWALVALVVVVFAGIWLAAALTFSRGPPHPPKERGHIERFAVAEEAAEEAAAAEGGGGGGGGGMLNSQGQATVDTRCRVRVGKDGSNRDAFHVFSRFEALERVPDDPTWTKCAVVGSGNGMLDPQTCTPVVLKRMRPMLPEEAAAAAAAEGRAGGEGGVRSEGEWAVRQVEETVANPFGSTGGGIIRSVRKDPMTGTRCIVTFDATGQTMADFKMLDDDLARGASIDPRASTLAQTQERSCQVDRDRLEAQASASAAEVTDRNDDLQTCRSALRDARLSNAAAAGESGGAAAPSPSSNSSPREFRMLKSLLRTDLCVDALGPSAIDGAEVVMRNCHGGPGQLFGTVPGATPWGPLVNQQSGMCLDVVTPAVTDGGKLKVVQKKCVPDASTQQFEVGQDGKLRHKATPGKCVSASTTGLGLGACDAAVAVEPGLGFFWDRVVQTDALRGEQSLVPGKALVSKSGAYKAMYSKDDDGSLVITDVGGRVIWSTNSALRKGASGKCVLHADGALVLYDAKAVPYWYSTGAPRSVHTARGGRPPHALTIGDDGILRVTDGAGSVMWKS